MTKMLLDLEFGQTRDHRENVASIIEKLADRKDMCALHDDDEKWADMFRDTVFVDDVKGGNELDKHLVIEARKTETEFLKKNGSVPQGSQVRGQETERRDHLDALDRHGQGLQRECELSLEAQASGSVLGHLAARHFKVARGRSCLKSEASETFEERKLRREQGVKAWCVSYRSAVMVRGTLRRTGRPHAPSSWSRSGSRGAERPTATSCTRRASLT